MSVKNILIVDDEVDIREILSMFVEPLGHNIICAENGEDALSQVENKSIDLILSDNKMPVMTGTDLLRNLREKGFNNIPFIFVSSFQLNGELPDSIVETIENFVTKPFTKDQVVEAVNSALSKCA